MFTEITLKTTVNLTSRDLSARSRRVDQLIECHLVSGGYDYLVKFVTTGIDECQAIMEQLLDLEIRIDKYFTFVVLKSPLIKVHLPLAMSPRRTSDFHVSQ